MQDSTLPVPLRILEAIGRPVDAGAAHDDHVATVGDTRLRLRRDCHGVLRRLEVRFEEDVGRRIAAAISWVDIVPGRLAVADVAGLGRLNRQPRRLDVTFRLHPDRQRLVWLLDLCTQPAGPRPGP